MSQSLLRKLQMDILAGIIMFAALLFFGTSISAEGMGYLGCSILIYELFWSFFGDRMGIISGRLMRSRFTKGQNRSARLIWRYVKTIGFVSAILGGFVLGGAGFALVNKGFNQIHASSLIFFFIPIFVLRMGSEVLGGYCLGKGSEVPSGITNIIRSFFIFILGAVFSHIMEGYGKKVSDLLQQDDFAAVYCAMGICLAWLIAEIVVFLMLFILRFVTRNHRAESNKDVYRSKDNGGNVFLEIASRRVMPLLCRVMLIIPLLIAAWFMEHRLGDGRLAARQIGYVLIGPGFYAGLFCLISGFITSSILSKMVTYFHNNEMRYARNLFQTGIHLSTIVGIFAASYLAAMSTSLASLFEKNPDDALMLANTMVISCFIALLIPISYFCYQFLVLSGKEMPVLIVEVLSGIILVVVENIYFSFGLTGTQALLYAAIFAYAVMAVALLLIGVYYIGMSLDLIRLFAVPVLSGCVVGLLNLFIGKLVTPHLGNIFTLIIGFVEMLILYFICLLLSRNLSEGEVRYLPFSKQIMALGQLLHIL